MLLTPRPHQRTGDTQSELTTTLQRLFRPSAPDDTAATIVLHMEGADMTGRMAGLYDESMPHPIGLAVRVARTELPAFANHLAAGTTVEVTARFEP